MKTWLINNAVWLGALGAISAVIATILMVLPNIRGDSATQELVIFGKNNETYQIDSGHAGKQTARVSGDGHKSIQATVDSD